MNRCALGSFAWLTDWFKAADRSVLPTRNRSEDVHTVRTTIKRLRAILRLIRPGISKTVFEREDSRLRQAARRLSLARDTQVARQTLSALPVPNKREQEAVAAVLAGLEADAEPQTGIDEAMRKVAADLEQTRRSLHQLRLGGEWNAIEPGLAAGKCGAKPVPGKMDFRRPMVELVCVVRAT
jgi:hypothetical protein